MISITGKAPKQDFTPLLSAAAEELGITEEYSLELIFVGRKRIKDTNREFRGVDKVTDILSFPAMDLSS